MDRRSFIQRLTALGALSKTAAGVELQPRPSEPVASEETPAAEAQETHWAGGDEWTGEGTIDGVPCQFTGYTFHYPFGDAPELELKLLLSKPPPRRFCKRGKVVADLGSPGKFTLAVIDLEVRQNRDVWHFEHLWSGEKGAVIGPVECEVSLRGHVL